MPHCKRCADKGLILIRYEESDGFDLAACPCPEGRIWRKPYFLRAWAAQLMTPPVQIGRLEEFEQGES